MRIARAAPMALIMLSSLAVTAHAQPRGSYLRSCTDVHMRGDALVAVCRRHGGDGMQRTVLPDVRSCVGDIGNQNGMLVCNRGPGPGPHRRPFRP
ncbi:MAG TPA: hypothetical protein VE993_04105 [Stellaceae bacterium]|nr:hypothetical protein [Stellaceae bacterium]